MTASPTTGGDRWQEAARELLRLWDAGERIRRLPEPIRPRTREEGYAVQAAMMERTRGPLFGWKIAATSEAGQRHVNVDGPMAGRLFAEQVIPDGAIVSLTGSIMRCAEVEFCFRMGRTLEPRPEPFTTDEVMAAVSTLHPAIELPDSRFEDFCAVGEAQLIADDACANLFVLGPAVAGDWRELDLAAHAVSGTALGKPPHEGSGAKVLGDPRVAMTWLANELRSLGLPLEAGQVVTTGTCIVPVEVEPGDEVVASWGSLGTLRVRFI